MPVNFVPPGAVSPAFGPTEPQPSNQLTYQELTLVLSKLIEELMKLIADLMRQLEASLSAGRDDAAMLDAAVMADAQLGG